MDVTTQEIWQAARRLVRTPLFTLTAALTLALAIAANASIFTVVNRVVVNPLPYPQSDRLIALDYGIPAQKVASGMNSMAWQLYFHLADHARTLEHVAVYNSGGGTLTGGGIPERLQITLATPSLVSVLGVQPALGRWFIEPEGVTGAAPVAVLSHGLWVRRFGGDRSIVGRSIIFDGVPTEVVGVMPATFSFPDSRTDMWTAGAVHTSQCVVSLHARRRGTTAKRRDHRERTHGNHIAHRGPVAHRTQPARADLDSHPAAGIAGRTNCASTLDADGGGRPRLAGRVRKRRQPVPGPLRDEAA